MAFQVEIDLDLTLAFCSPPRRWFCQDGQTTHSGTRESSLSSELLRVESCTAPAGGCAPSAAAARTWLVAASSFACWPKARTPLNARSVSSALLGRQGCLPMAEEAEAPTLTARRAAQHVRISSADDACEYLYILTLRPSLGPLHLMLADTPWPRGFGAALASVDTFSDGSRTVRCLPALPCTPRTMGRTV